jgi:REP element-mobilizing transposase RayT
MSLHSYSRCWLHLTWATLGREALLPKPAAAKLSRFLHDYAQSKDIYMRINYVNAEHVHALIDLPTRYLMTIACWANTKLNQPKLRSPSQ